ARNIGRPGRRRIFSAPLHDVRPVDARRCDFDQHLTCAGRRGWPFHEHEDFGTTGLANFDRDHELSVNAARVVAGSRTSAASAMTRPRLSANTAGSAPTGAINAASAPSRTATT